MYFEIEDIRRIFSELERDFPVDTWHIGNVHVWPVIRIDLYLKMFAAEFGGAAIAQVPAGPAVTLLRRLNRTAKTCAALIRASLAPQMPGGAGLKAADALLLSDGISFAQIGGKAYEKFCDPVASLLARAHKSTLLLNPAASYTASGYTNTLPLHAQLDSARVRSLVRKRKFGTGIPGEYARFETVVRERYQLAAMPWDAVRRSLEIIEAQAAVFERVMQAVQPKVAFLVSYYCNEGFAFCLACRRAGIRAVDLQHGAAGNMNAAYGFWNRVPRTGFDLLPSDFWCWSVEDAAAINAWAVRTAAQHRAHAGTHLLLALFRAGMAPVNEQERAALATLAGDPRRARKLTLLVTLQPNYLTDSAWRARLHALMQEAGDRVVWWVRLHPMMPERPSAIAAMFPAGLCIEAEACSTLPLYSLLPEIDLHVTHSSSTVIEAAQFGAASLILSTLGGGYYADHVKDGMAAVFTAGEGGLGLIEAFSARRRRGNAQGDARAALARTESDLLKFLPKCLDRTDCASGTKM